MIGKIYDFTWFERWRVVLPVLRPKIQFFHNVSIFHLFPFHTGNAWRIVKLMYVLDVTDKYAGLHNIKDKQHERFKNRDEPRKGN